jgi:osmoprotectant transport system ATP-binding protein
VSSVKTDARRGARVVLEGVTVHRGGVPVVRDVNLSIEPGELVVLIGPSGSGKSTLLSAIPRLIDLATGSISIDGDDTRQRDVHALRRSIGFCFQGLGLFPHMTVRENIAVGPRIAGWDAARIAARVTTLLEVMSLPSAFADRMPNALSGGQAQRVAVARALALEPPLLLLDEPFGALDPQTRERLQEELRALHQRLGVTTVLVSHDLSEALRLGDRVAVMIDGALVQVSAPAVLVTAPANQDVRALLAPALDHARSLLALVNGGAP